MIKEIINSYKTNRESHNMLRRLTPSPSAPQNPVPDGRAGNSDLPCPKPNQITKGRVNTPNETPPTQNFQGFVQDEDENIHVKITRNPADLETDNYNDSRKATSVFQYFMDNRFTRDIYQSIEFALRDYNVCARQHNLSPKTKG